ncbi:MAG TPA: helix-turn-helix domain-containing protein [Acidimicrobiales bacterium]|jgi:AcrR family transcriptional regulator
MPSIEELRSKLSYKRDLIAEAALRCFSRTPVDDVSIADIIREAGIPRSSAYREFPGGKSEITRYLHIQTVLIVRGAIRRRISSPHFDNYRSIVQEAARGLFDGLSWAPWTGEFLVKRPGLATAYALNPEEGGLIREIGDYAASCAARFGATNATLPARRLVRDLLTEACRELEESAEPSWPAEFPSWPRWIDTTVEAFLRSTKLQNLELPSGITLHEESPKGSIAGLLAAAGAARI